MSIIIRLQNLPWTANAFDIRRYFVGLTIPEGGVHIVGGEKGDAFIVFGTDEDARQAMERDGGKIKDAKVKLLLSSRTEMSRVIELARNQNLSLQVPAAVKAAAATDSDRRRAPSPRRKEREKTPPRDRDRERERRRSSRRDRSRSRSRTPPPRKSRDREREDRRSDRSRREDRHEDSNHDRYKHSVEYGSREHSQDRRQFPVAEKAALPRPSMDTGKTFDPRAGSTPQTYGARPMDGTEGNFKSSHESIPPRNVPFVNPQTSEAPLYYSGAMGAVGIPPEAKSAVEPLKPPEFISGSFPFDKRAATVENYEAKRPSPTPATSAPNVGSSAPYAKDYGMPDPYSSNIPHGYGEYPDEYSRAQTAERGTVPAIPNDRRNFPSNLPIYGAEPHARYDLIPEANQAGRSSNIPAPKEMAGHEIGLYGKMTSTPVAPATSSATTAAVPKPLRRSRFEPEFSPAQENQYRADSSMKLTSRTSFVGPSDSPKNLPQSMESSFVNQRDRPNMGNEAPWPPHASGPPHAPERWDTDSRTMMMMQPQQQQQQSSMSTRYDDDMEIDDDQGDTAMPPSFHTSAPPMANRNFMRHESEDRVAARDQYGYHNKRPLDGSREGTIPPNIPDRFASGDGLPNPSMSRNDTKNMPLAVEISGLPSNVSERDLSDFFAGMYVPRENIKFGRNRQGRASAYVKLLNIRDFEVTLSRNRCKICGTVVEISPCSLAVFNSVSDSPLSYGRAPEIMPDHSFNKRREPELMRNAPSTNYSHVSDQVKKPVDIDSRKPPEHTMYQSRPNPVPQSITESMNIAKSQVETASVPSRHAPPRRPEIIHQQQKPEVPQREVPEPVPQAQPVEKKPEMKPYEAQRGKEPAYETPPAPIKERKSSDSPAERKSSEVLPSSRPTPPEPKRKSPERPPPPKSVDIRPSRKPHEPLIPPRNTFDTHRDSLGPDHSRNPPPLRKRSQSIPPRKSYDRLHTVHPIPAPARSNLEPCEDDLVVELRGLPFTCEEDEIVHFFDGLGILDIFVELGPEGHATGVGFVEFATPADFHAALDLSGKRIGHRYIDILVSSKEIMAVARGDRPKPPLLPQGPPREIPHPSVPPTPAYCVAVNNLPKHIKSRDIADFFGDIVPMAIHTKLTPNKIPTGEAFAEFRSRADLEAAVRRDGCMMAGVRILVSPISYEEMVDLLGSAPQLPPALPPGPGPLLMHPPESDLPPSRRALMPLPMDDEMPIDDHRPLDKFHGRPDDKFHSRPDYHPNDRIRFDHPESRIPGRPNPLPPRGRVAPPRPESSRGRSRIASPSSGPPSFRARRPGPALYPGPPPRNGREPADFGLPGCVVGIDNLHFRAGLEDLLDFFRDYDIDKNSIIRKYNENGQATGEARVAFNCHEDAIHAVRELHMKPIMGRPISLTIV